MHEVILALLPQAEGHSCRVIAVFLDIRGFTSFAGANESTDAAAFLRTMYVQILTKYFDEGRLFFKPTGDGLMIVLDHPTDRDEFKERMRDVLRRAIRLVAEFPTIAEEDVMVNFEVPKQLGIGIARGSVTVLQSGDVRIDYTGRCLNLAARLMDLARPSGVVFSDKLAETILDDDFREQFERKLPYLPGILPAPTEVFATRQWTEIPESALRPPTKSWIFDQNTVTVTVQQLRSNTGAWVVRLSQKPPDEDNLLVRVHFKRDAGGGDKWTTATDLPARFHPQPYGPAAICSIDELLEWADEHELTDSETLTLQAKYLA